MKTKAYTETLIARLAEVGITARIEDNFQRVLSEDICQAIVDILTLATQRAAPIAWDRSTGFISFLTGERDEDAMRRTSHNILVFGERLESRLTDACREVADVRAIIDEVLTFLDRSLVCSALPQYAQGSFLDSLLEDLAEFISEARSRLSWPEAIASVIGNDSIPIMTTHKSKGLEFHTMVFIGLEDDALFNYARDSDEETCGLFVALSRAKQRAYFTYCTRRSVGRCQAKSRNGIQGLYDLFVHAGVEVESVA